MIHAMIDIETLGVGTQAPLFEIACVLFNPENGEEISHMHAHVDIMDVMWRTGRCPQPGTLDWWRTQQYDPTVVDDRVTLSDSVSDLIALYEGRSVEKTWANSPSFDLVILEGHFASVGEEVPWSYREELDFRTVRWMAKRKGWTQPRTAPTHNALEDCRLQVGLLMEMINV